MPHTYIYHSIENCFFTLLDALKKRGDTKDYSNLVRLLFTELSIEKTGDLYNAFKILGHLRNSIHNNHVHTHEDCKYLLENTDFEFKKNSHVEFKSLDDYFLILTKVIDSLKELMQHEKVKQLSPDVVRERYAQSVESTAS